ncbi:MAG: SdrD B-like domain-containing protein, partial [Bacteroidota bacterium]
MRVGTTLGVSYGIGSSIFRRTIFALSVLTLFGPSEVQAQTITGQVFRDYNASGVQNTGSVAAQALDDEYGEADITIRAFAPGQTTPAATATSCGGAVACSGADRPGAFTLSGLTNGTVYRLEASGLPAHLQSGAAGSTRVLFAQAGDTGVNIGLANPGQYCTENPEMLTTCFSNGDPLGGGDSGTDPWIVQFPNNPATTSGANVYLAEGRFVGSTWGLAYHRHTGTLYAGAFVKRHSGLGPGGTGALYAIDVVNQTASVFANLATDYAADTGTISNRSLPADRNDPNRDAPAFDAVGKMALGDLDLSDDGRTLYVMNVRENAVYQLDIGLSGTKPGSATKHTLPTPSCTGGVFRAFALAFHDGKLYAGGTCTAESGGTASNLAAYVYEHDPAGATGNFQLVFSVPLNYPRAFVTNSGIDNGNIDIGAEWRPWIDTWQDYEALNQPQPFGTQVINPQPMLSDIEVDVDGSFVLGVMDRWGHQTGNANFSTIASDTDTYEGTAGGDLIRMCPDGSGGFVLESNATCGGVTTAGTSSNPAQGNGGGEYYWQDMYSLSTSKNAGTHNEITIGGLSLLEGTGEIGTTVFDPLTDFRAGGVGWFSNALGTRPHSYEIFGEDEGGGGPVPATFGKASGLGDMEAICPITPLELGNRVWCDTNNDGIQDGDEAGINGLEIVLLCDAGGGSFAEIGRATTVNDARGYAGSYVFTDAGVGGAGIPRNTDCRLTID